MHCTCSWIEQHASDGLAGLHARAGPGLTMILMSAVLPAVQL